MFFPPVIAVNCGLDSAPAWLVYETEQFGKLMLGGGSLGLNAGGVQNGAVLEVQISVMIEHGGGVGAVEGAGMLIRSAPVRGLMEADWADVRVGRMGRRRGARGMYILVGQSEVG